MGIVSSLQAIQTVLNPAMSYWKVVLTNNKELTEHKLVLDFRRGGYRPIDWALDLNSTGDLKRIKELYLICPNGQQVMLSFPLGESGTAFQFKHGTMDAMGACGRNIEAQCIGKVTNKEEGTCECWIWDKVDGLIHYNSNIHEFGMWRKNTGLIPIKDLSKDVTGLRLG